MNVPAVHLVGYQTSQKDIKDHYHEIYLLKRLSGLLPCWADQMEEAIKDILSSPEEPFMKMRGYCNAGGPEGAAAAAPQPRWQRGSHSWS